MPRRRMGETALKSRIPKSEAARATTRANTNKGYFGLAVYALCAVVAFWYPRPVLIFTGVLWVVWLIVGIRISPDEGH